MDIAELRADILRLREKYEARELEKELQAKKAVIAEEQRESMGWHSRGARLGLGLRPQP